MSHLRISLLATAALTSAAPAAGQTLETADSLLARRDTAAAIAAYASILKRNPRNPEAHYRTGLLYMSRHVAPGHLSPDRLKAEEHFRYATRFQSDSAKYWIALADAFRSEDILTVRAQVAGLLERAKRAAIASGDRGALVDAAYRQARAAWVTYGAFGHRFQRGVAGPSPRGADQPTPREDARLPAPQGQSWKDVIQLFTELLVPVPNAGAEYLDAAEENLRLVMSRAPLHLDGAGLMAVVMGERQRWPEAAALARRLVRSVPDSGRAWALYGLTLARTNRWKESQAAFDSAFRRMNATEMAPFRRLEQIMRQADGVRFGQLSSAHRVAFDSLYWRAAKPLALSQVNEIQAEFYARIVYADHHWSDPWRGYRGIETDPGAVYVAYGPPDIWAVRGGDDGADARATATWIYQVPQFLFSFYQVAGFSRAHFDGESEWLLSQAKILAPSRFDNVPVIRTLDTVLIQSARFRGTGDSLAVVVVGAIPLRRMADSVAVQGLPFWSGALLTDSLGHELRRDRNDERVSGTDAQVLQNRSWRMQLTPGTYQLRVEAQLPAIDRAARGVQQLDVVSVPDSGLALSDILVARRLERRDSTAVRWSDYLIEPSAGQFEPGEPIGLLWEMYNLIPDSAGAANYEVGLWISMEAVDRSEARVLGSQTLAEIVGGIGDILGVTARYADRVSLGYQQTLPAHPGRAQAEHLLLELHGAPAGRYQIELIVRDLHTGLQATALRSFSIGTEPIRRERF